MSKKISEVNLIATINGDERIPLFDPDQPGTDLSASVAQIATFAVAAHEAATDPHPGYLTQAEGDALYAPIGGGAQNIGPYDIGAYYPGKPAVSATVLMTVASRPITLLASDPGNAEAAVAATAPAVFTITRDSGNIGSITFGAGATVGTITLTTNTQIAIGQQIKVIAPASQDATLADLVITLKGKLETTTASYTKTTLPLAAGALGAEPLFCSDWFGANMGAYVVSNGHAWVPSDPYFIFDGIPNSQAAADQTHNVARLTAALQNARAFGFGIFFPEGDWYFNAPIPAITTPAITLAGPANTSYRFTHRGANLIPTFTPTGNNVFIRFEDTASIGQDLGPAIENLNFWDGSAGQKNIILLRLANANRGRIDGCGFWYGLKGIEGEAVPTVSPASSGDWAWWEIRNSRFVRNGTGVDILNGYGVLFDGCEFTDNDKAGIVRGSMNRFLGCMFDPLGTGDDGLFVLGNHTKIAFCKFEGGAKPLVIGDTTSAVGTHKRNTVLANTISGNAGKSNGLPRIEQSADETDFLNNKFEALTSSEPINNGRATRIDHYSSGNISRYLNGATPVEVGWQLMAAGAISGRGGSVRDFKLLVDGGSGLWVSTAGVNGGGNLVANHVDRLSVAAGAWGSTFGGANFTPLSTAASGVILRDGEWQFWANTGLTAGTAFAPTTRVKITPSGLEVPSSAWNAQRILLGSYHLWVDGSGRLRIKSGAPTSDTDGTVVGAQT